MTLQEAVLGTTLEVPTIKGPVRLTIPPNSGRGTRLRLRGRGIEGTATSSSNCIRCCRRRRSRSSPSS